MSTGAEVFARGEAFEKLAVSILGEKAADALSAAKANRLVRDLIDIEADFGTANTIAIVEPFLEAYEKAVDLFLAGKERLARDELIALRAKIAAETSNDPNAKANGISLKIPDVMLLNSQLCQIDFAANWDGKPALIIYTKHPEGPLAEEAPTRDKLQQVISEWADSHGISRLEKGDRALFSYVAYPLQYADQARTLIGDIKMRFESKNDEALFSEPWHKIMERAEMALGLSRAVQR